MKAAQYATRWMVILGAAAMLCSGLPLGAQVKPSEEFTEAMASASRLRNPETQGRGTPARNAVKCGLGAILEVRERWNLYSLQEQQSLSAVLAPVVTQKSRTIGHFTIFYDTTGVHAPALLDAGHNRIPNTVEAYVDSVGTYFNLAWSFEIDSLGYDSPPFLPGESTYDVYLHEENSGLYGFTMPVHQINSAYPPLYDSYIEVDNDYLGFYSEGMKGLAVTSAHEFHHAIQLGRYGYWSGDRYFLELTSTWMEDVVHDNVNDYYQYLANTTDQTSQFSYPYVRFTRDDNSIEYSRAVWGKFVEQRFSREVMRSTWNHIRQVNAIAALDRALVEAGSSFRLAFFEWALWNMNTGANADTSAYFYDEGRAYPTMRMNAMTSFTSGQRLINGSTEVMSSQYFPILMLPPAGDSSRMNAIVTNVNMNTTSQSQPFSYFITDHGDDSYKHLSNGLYVQLSISDPLNWSTQEVIVDTGGHIRAIPQVVPDIVVYPNPFVVNGSAKLNFQMPELSSTEATLTILSSGMDRIFSKAMPFIELRPQEKYLQWDGYDENGRTASTGIYFYFISSGDREFNGKFAIIRQ